jgi:hypothetical protein
MCPLLLLSLPAALEQSVPRVLVGRPKTVLEPCGAVSLALDEIMDILTDINTTVMPTNSKHSSLANSLPSQDSEKSSLLLAVAGWDTSFVMLYSMGLCFGCAMLFKCFTVSHDLAGQHYSDHDRQVQDLVSGFMCLAACNYALLIPAQTSTMCTRVIGCINEQRRCLRSSEPSPPQSPKGGLRSRTMSSTRARDKHAIVSDSEILRLECLSAYIREANGGLGMGYILFGIRLSASHVKNIIRALVPLFSYLYSHVAATTAGANEGTNFTNFTI